MPDSQAGHFHKSELRLLLDSCDEHNDASYQREPSEYRGNRNVVVFFRGCVDRPDIKNFFLMSVGKSLIGEGKTAQNDEENASVTALCLLFGHRRELTPRFRPSRESI